MEWHNDPGIGVMDARRNDVDSLWMDYVHNGNLWSARGWLNTFSEIRQVIQLFKNLI